MFVNKGADAKPYIFEEACGWTLNSVSKSRIQSKWKKNQKAKERKMKAKAVAKARNVSQQAQFTTSSKQRLQAEAAEENPEYVPGKKASKETAKRILKSLNKTV